MSSKRLLRTAIAALLVLGVAGGAASAQSPYASDMQAGREAFDGSNYQLAERYFKGAFENAQSDGQKGTALYSLAVAAHKQGKTDEAKEHANKALEFSPKNSQARRLIEELNTVVEKGPAKGAKQAKAAAKSESPPAQADTSTGERPAPRKNATLATAKAAEPKEPAAKASAPAAKETKEVATPEPAPAAPKTAAAPPVTPVAKEKRAATEVQTGAIPPAPKAAEPAPAKSVEPPAKAAEAKAPAPKLAEVKSAAAAKAEPPATPLVAQDAASLPAGLAPVLAAGFSGNDRNVTVVTGPRTAAEKADQSIDMKRLEISAGSAVDAFNLHSDVAIGRVAVAASGPWIATAVPIADGQAPRRGKGATVSLHVWDNALVENQHAIEMPIADPGSSAVGIDAMALSRNGRRLVVAHRTGIEILDTNGLRGVAAYRFSPRQKIDGADAPAALAVSANGMRVVLTNGTRLRVTDGANVRDIGPAASRVVFDEVALTDDGKLVAAAGGRSIRFFDHASGKEAAPLPDTEADVTALAFSPNGERLAVASGDRLQLWSVSGRKQILELTLPGPASRVAFSGDGRMVLAAGEKGSRAWLLEPIVVGSVSKPEPSAQPATAPSVAVASAAPQPAGTDAAPAANPQSARAEEAKEAANTAAPAAAAPPAAERPRQEQELIVARTRAIARGECDKVKALDALIGDAGEHDACFAKAEQQRRDAERSQRVVDRRVALEAADCDRVKVLDAEIGDAAQHGVCIERAAARAKAAERTKLLADHKVALEKLDCAEAKALDEKLGLGDARALAACSFQSVLKSGNARELFLTAAKHDADKDRANALRLYRAIVDRFPQDDLAIKAAERMTVLADQEAAGAKPQGNRQQKR